MSEWGTVENIADNELTTDQELMDLAASKREKAKAAGRREKRRRR
jgi:hypothetical protein